jgi:hypothetical protein
MRNLGVSEVTRKGILTVAAFVTLAAIFSAQAASHSLKSVIAAVMKNGLDAQLPAHLSVILGVSSVERATAVKQAVIRERTAVHTFNVGAANHDDVVILAYDERDHATKAYLVSNAAELLKAVSYQPGAPANERSLGEARSDFFGELKIWTQYQDHLAKLK